ncbi:MAG: hypothetical protein A3E05_02365 [Candidatus Jacksonbacteria bacterium RIFCSPHIGHO2_12_FULL_44_12]|nr:MAG: hypothetical protein A3E05_02365 [Candidatus Jacksonbacteria bacterium RIFCSPHIGHO2_12_FULL_44_12]
MRTKQENNISESQIEDALVANLVFLAKILKVPADIKLIARQLKLKSVGERIDLLLSSGKHLCLVELKVVGFSNDWLKQIISYRDELINLQNAGELVSGEILCFLLITDAKEAHIKSAKQNGVEVVIYQPIEALKNYYENLATVAPFLKMKPNDYGVFNIGLINRTLYEIANGAMEQENIALKINLSKGSVRNHLRLASEFDLVRMRNKKYFLTDRGDQYVQNFNKNTTIEILSEKQIEILKEFVSKDPFYSPYVFGVYSIIESAFLLARNFYPVQLTDLRKVFKIISGKESEWQAERSLNTATYTFLNYAIDLELLGKIGQQIVITPAGFRFILMLQLHKSIEMIESLSTNKN